ncbi:hypothetical protein VE03_05596 [Pseudogymnoascus sp. 23342-1-I1]|nr:hypothetical protein VE03_05596 [Pseudogymnoascus sp. 23342-1-I1]
MEPPPSKGELGTSPSPPSPTTPAPDSIDEKKANIQEATSVSTAQPQDQGQDQEQDVGLARERWNSSSTNVARYLQTLLAFLVMGVSDASLGALLPYIEEYYNINYTIVACMFLSPFAGYTLSAFLISKIHMRFGQVGIAVIAPLCKIIAYVITCVHPPFPVIPVFFVLSGLGNGLEDGAWNAWVGNMENANELMGILHGAYGLGGAIGPLISTAMVTKGGLHWYTWYYVMVGFSALEIIVGYYAFRTATGSVYRAKHPVSTTGPPESRTREALKSKITWLVAVFLLAYVGAEVALGGWIVTFMLQMRHGEPFASGMIATGFWLGLTAGRVALGFVTGRIGEKLAVALYLALSVAMQLLFWLIPSFVASAIFAAFLGFFLGPLFPAAIMVATKLLPPRLHVSAIGFVAAFGSSGAAVFPFVVGAIAQAKGVWVLQPFALALLGVIFISWVALPGGFRKSGLDVEQKKVLKVEKERGTLGTGPEAVV